MSQTGPGWTARIPRAEASRVSAEEAPGHGSSPREPSLQRSGERAWDGAPPAARLLPTPCLGPWPPASACSPPTRRTPPSATAALQGEQVPTGCAFPRRPSWTTRDTGAGRAPHARGQYLSLTECPVGAHSTLTTCSPPTSCENPQLSVPSRRGTGVWGRSCRLMSSA